MTPRHAKLYTLKASEIIVAREAYEVYIYNSKQPPFPLNDKEWATGAGSKVNVEQWPVETILIDGKPEHLVLDPHLRAYLEEPFRQKLDSARFESRELRRECRLLREELVDATVQIKNLTAPWYTQLWRILRGEP